MLTVLKAHAFIKCAFLNWLSLSQTDMERMNFKLFRITKKIVNMAGEYEFGQATLQNFA
jgi:hypothetical protein